MGGSMDRVDPEPPRREDGSVDEGLRALDEVVAQVIPAAPQGEVAPVRPRLRSLLPQRPSLDQDVRRVGDRPEHHVPRLAPSTRAPEEGRRAGAQGPVPTSGRALRRAGGR